MSLRVIRPLIVVLGGIRVAPVEALHRKTMRTRTLRRQRNGVPTAEKKAQHHVTVYYPRELKAANRFRKNAAALLRSCTFSTPIGRIALANSIGALVELREKALEEAVAHNQDNPHWHVLVEGPTWAYLPEDAQSVLLTTLGGRLPEWMFEG